MKIIIISTNKSKYISKVRSVYTLEFAPYRILETIILKRKEELRPNYLSNVANNFLSTKRGKREIDWFNANVYILSKQQDELLFLRNVFDFI